MDENKKKFYAILIGVSLLSAVIIMLIPAKKGNSTPEKKGTVIIEDKRENDLANAIIENMGITTEEPEISGSNDDNVKIVKRDIFINPYGETAAVPVAEAPALPPVKPVPTFKAKGVLITDKKRSVILDSGKIVNEGEEYEGYKFSNIQKGEVILISKEREIIKIKIWEE